MIRLKNAEDKVQFGLIQGNLYEVIERMRREPVGKFALKIPLCRLVYMPMVRPTLQSDVVKLMGAFRYGYKLQAAAMYVSETNKDGESRMVMPEDIEKWRKHWREENEAFEERLLADPDLVGLSRSMFFVYDGNHRLLAWREAIDTIHSEDRDWYQKNGNPNCVVLDIKGGRGDILNAMHDINKYGSIFVSYVV